MFVIIYLKMNTWSHDHYHLPLSLNSLKRERRELDLFSTGVLELIPLSAPKHTISVKAMATVYQSSHDAMVLATVHTTKMRRVVTHTHVQDIIDAVVPECAFIPVMSVMASLTARSLTTSCCVILCVLSSAHVMGWLSRACGLFLLTSILTYVT